MTTLKDYGVAVEPHHGILMPKVTNRFRVLFENFAGDDNLRLTQQVVSITRPSLTFASIALDEGVYTAGEPIWEAITLVLRDEVTDKTRLLILQQIERQVDEDDHAFNMKIELLDGSENTLEVWEVNDCRIVECDMGTLDYSSAEPMTITLAIEFDTVVAHA